MDTITSIADDELVGAEAISRFINKSLTRTYVLLETGVVPAGKWGNVWVGSKATILDHYRRMTAGNGVKSVKPVIDPKWFNRKVRGRRPGSRLVNGKVVGPDEEGAAA
jgi:hypothetical protein